VGLLWAGTYGDPPGWPAAWQVTAGTPRPVWKGRLTMTHPDILAALARELSATVLAEAEGACWTVRRASQMTAAATGLATMAYPEVTAAPRTVVSTPGGRGYDGLLRSWGRRC
jgi:hypothetical protein